MVLRRNFTRPDGSRIMSINLAPLAPKLLSGDASVRPALHNLPRRHQWIATFEA